VGLIAGLEVVAKRRIACSCRESNPDRSSLSLVSILTELLGPFCVIVGGLN
jgi:hypothetical protein